MLRLFSLLHCSNLDESYVVDEESFPFAGMTTWSSAVGAAAFSGADQRADKTFLEGRVVRRHAIPHEDAPAGASRHGHRSSYRFVVDSVSCDWPCADRGRMAHQDVSPISGAFGQFEQSWVFSHDDSVSCIVMRMHPAERQLK